MWFATYQTLEGELADQKLGGLLVATNLTKSDGTGLVAVRLLDTSGGGGALAGGLGGELLAGSLATSGLTGGCESQVSKDVDWRYRRGRKTYSAWCGPLLLCVMMGLMDLFVGDDVPVG